MAFDAAMKAPSGDQLQAQYLPSTRFAATDLSRLKNVDPGLRSNGLLRLATRLQSSVLQILTVLSSDFVISVMARVTLRLT